MQKVATDRDPRTTYAVIDSYKKRQATGPVDRIHDQPNIAINPFHTIATMSTITILYLNPS